ncbi:MAG: hypothetical protein ACR2QT_11645 [Woeseiaceae bacterium]
MNRPMQMSAEEHHAHSPQWILFRDLAVLQVKLIVDGFRDILLLPASIVAAIVSFSRSEDGVPGPEFYKLLALGKQSESWINLFGALKNAPESVDQSNEFGDVDIDSIVTKVETFVVAEYKRGGVTAQAKSRIDEALKTMREKKQAKE